MKKVPSIIVRLSNIYGYTKLIRPDLVPTLKNVLNKDEVTIWNDNQKETLFLLRTRLMQY